MSDFLSVNRAAFEDNGIADYLNSETEAKFEALCRIMKEKNAEMNITAITDDDAIARKHFCDCVFLSTVLPDRAKVADIGCGGGFPCLPVAITRQDLCGMTAIDSTAKKVNYVAETARALGLDRFESYTMRAEDGAHDAKFREQYDAVSARAVANLAILCELCIPYVKVGGRFFAMKGRGAAEELAEAKNAIEVLGGKVEKVHEFSLHTGTEIQPRYIIEIVKTSRTPAEYPRQYAKIKKRPL